MKLNINGIQIFKKAKVSIAIAVFLLILVAHELQQPLAVNAQETSGAAVINGTNGAMSPMGENDPHMRLSPIRAITPGDRDQAERLANTLKQAISKYERVRDAEEAGYIKFPPNAEGLKIVHYVNPWLSFLETWRLDPKQPGALLYQRQADGELKLLGAMFTAPAEATPEKLNERVPLSVTRWHLHVNMCLPEPIWDEQQWQRQRDGQPLFGPDSPIATKAECQQINGKFEPTVFGWMVHVNAFARDPQDVFNHHYGG